MDEMAFQSIRQRLQNGDSSEAASALRELASDTASATQHIAQAVQRLRADPFLIPAHDLVTLITGTGSEELFQAVKDRIFSGPFELAELLSVGFQNLEIEERLLEHLERIARTDSPLLHGHAVVKALASNGSASAIDILEQVRFDLTPKLKARLLTYQGKGLEELKKGASVDEVAYDLGTKDLGTFVALVEQAIAALRSRWPDAEGDDGIATARTIRPESAQAAEPIIQALTRCEEQIQIATELVALSRSRQALDAVQIGAERALEALLHAASHAPPNADSLRLNQLISVLNGIPECSAFAEIGHRIWRLIVEDFESQGGLLYLSPIHAAPAALVLLRRLFEAVKSHVKGLNDSILPGGRTR